MAKLNSKIKGCAGERELARILVEHGYTSRRGHQMNGQTDEADVIGLPGIHIECKRVEHLNIYNALDQSKRDARDGEIPVVIHRRNRDEWKVTMRLEDWLELYGRWNDDKSGNKQDKSQDA